jgi:SAM-dependent methyltransferase
MITVDFKYLQPRSRSRILDIGCGTGRHTAAAYDLNRGSVVGADPNFRDLIAARERLNLHMAWNPRKNRAWSLASADITRLPFKKDSFDIVICSEVLEHIGPWHRAVHESIRVLKPNGHLVISVPRRWPETICWALSPGYRNVPGGHIRIFHSSHLIRWIRSRGLPLKHSHFAHGLHTPYWWLKCLLGIKRRPSWPVAAYHRLLTWDMMKKPRLTRCLERWLNPVMGKSVVLYFRKAIEQPVPPCKSGRAPSGAA